MDVSDYDSVADFLSALAGLYGPITVTVGEQSATLPMDFDDLPPGVAALLAGADYLPVCEAKDNGIIITFNHVGCTLTFKPDGTHVWEPHEGAGAAWSELEGLFDGSYWE